MYSIIKKFVKKHESIISGFLLMLIFYFLFSAINTEISSLKSDGNCAIGITTGYIGQDGIKYEFEVNSKTYKSKQNEVFHDVEPNNGRYVVIYLPKNPEINNILYNKPIVNNISDFDCLDIKKDYNFIDILGLNEISAYIYISLSVIFAVTPLIWKFFKTKIKEKKLP
jgi:hypothetical protein